MRLTLLAALPLAMSFAMQAPPKLPPSAPVTTMGTQLVVTLPYTLNGGPDSVLNRITGPMSNTHRHAAVGVFATSDTFMLARPAGGVALSGTVCAIAKKGTKASAESCAPWTWSEPAVVVVPPPVVGPPTVDTTGGGGTPPPASGYPNQPAGFVRFAEHQFQAIPAGSNGLAGTWYNTEPDPETNILADATDPTGEGTVLQITYPSGLAGGDSPAHFGYADWATEYKRVYHAVWLKIAGADYQQQAVGTKLWFYSINAPGGNDQYVLLNGTGVLQTITASTLEFRQQNQVNRNIEANVNTGNLFTVGAWHRVEVLIGVNDPPTAANGTLKMWIDGILTHNYSDVQYRTAGAGFGHYLHEWKVNPTWGGAGGVRTRDDFLRFGHSYLSGVVAP